MTNLDAMKMVLDIVEAVEPCFIHDKGGAWLTTMGEPVPYDDAMKAVKRVKEMIAEVDGKAVAPYAREVMINGGIYPIALIEGSQVQQDAPLGPKVPTVRSCLWAVEDVLKDKDVAETIAVLTKVITARAAKRAKIS